MIVGGEPARFPWIRNANYQTDHEDLDVLRSTYEGALTRLYCGFCSSRDMLPGFNGAHFEYVDLRDGLLVVTVWS